MVERVRRKDSTRATFVLPAGHPCGDVSVVGDFDDGRPRIHPLGARTNVTRSVTVAMPADERVHFGHLAHGDYWFDDSADSHNGHDGRNSHLRT